MSGSNAFEMELQALKSIYGSDLLIEQDAIVIRLHPLSDYPKEDNVSFNEYDAQIDLQVSCPENYPYNTPKIALKNSKGLSNKQISILKSELNGLMETLLGKPMIYDLAYHVLKYLLDNNKPLKKSFYDEMIFRKQQEKAKFKSDEDRRMRKIFDAQKKVQLKIGERDSSDEDDTDKSHNNFQSILMDGTNCEMSESKITCNPITCHCSKYIHFQNKVLRGCCTDHCKSSNVYCALDTANGEQLTVHEWILKPNEKVQEVEKILRSIQNEFNYLKILKHENLNIYIDYKFITDKDEWTVYIAEKYISGVTLKTLINQKWITDLDLVQNIVESVLKALSYLHDHKVVHKNLNEGNIYFSKSGQIKLASCSVIKRMDDLFRLCKGEVITDVKIDQKTDVMQLGLILTTVLEFILKFNEHIEISDHKVLELKDFIKKCLIKNEEKMWGARELLDHNFLQNNSSYESSTRKKLSFSKQNFEIHDEIPDQYDFSHAEQKSRLLKDFYILEDIGKGSFGKVLKVRNKLDGQIYAIKEIKLDRNSQQLDKKIIGEVKLLSKLKHENVVRYYTSWIESYSETESVLTETSDKSKDDNEEEEDEEDEDEDDDDDDDDEDDEDEDEDQSLSIIFQSDEKESPSNNSSERVSESRKSQSNSPLTVRLMYIQMEFCEKSTLKYAINNNLHEQEIRCWRLLREIVEGLTYIHEQRLIHRDLKPDNIFLDYNDHVKIGDFGLAKIRGISRCAVIIPEVALGGGDNDNSQQILGGSDTPGVGTSYYVAPEMSISFEKFYYNEKVDIYSLGIIFFEMCHPPFTTGMERYDVLTKLRKPEIIIPPSMEENLPRQMELVRMLLIRDPALRPSSQEILEDRVPPAEIEFEELKEIVRKTLNSSETKGYKYLISSCLNQKMSIDEDITYQLKNFHSDKFYISLETAREPIENIFKNHGAVCLSTPLLLPQNEVYANIDARVKLMTQSGSVVNLPYDLRIPFARCVTSKNIRRLRRYSFDRVHREQRIHGLPPKELYECAFDIVSPKIGNLADEWEIFCVMNEVVNSIPSLKNRNCVIVLNHALILRALLIYCNVEKLYSEVFKFLIDAKTDKYAKRQLEANLLSLELGTQVVSTLLSFFGKEDTVYALREELLMLFCNRRDAYEKAEKGFEKLIKINEEAKNFGINVPIRARLGIVCNTEYCADIMFDLICKTKQKRGKESNDVIMSGCRYDGLIRNFRKVFFMNVDIKDANQSAIGVSISLDKLASLLQEDNVLTEHVVVCSTGYWVPNEVKTSFIKELRESKIKCYFEDAIDSVEELLEHCEENKITHVVNLREENGLVLVMSWDSSKCRYREKKISRREVAEYILKNSKSSEDQPVNFQRSDSKTTSTEVSVANQSLNIQILTDEKSLSRRKYENQIRSKITPLLRHFSPKTRVEVVGVDLDEGEISRLALSFRHDDSSYISKILSSIDRSARKTYLSKICAKLESFFTPEKSNVLVMLYGLGHDKYQMILG